LNEFYTCRSRFHLNSFNLIIHVAIVFRSHLLSLVDRNSVLVAVIVLYLLVKLLFLSPSFTGTILGDSIPDYGSCSFSNIYRYMYLELTPVKKVLIIL